ncbi:uncharacterized protein PV09_04002 [Verruconis gallopava]|uniref:BTB domain-containing protein n=1 Tax=Verruconis gallopava TaxID=253628 RepID=A0A0D1YVU3_9PEZI|nr:uncharacterized protein PV09_04002 [Verruconis gallopava]KIW04817.1 hypothetical protein PV09_04002 [Verruconis gallopava]
MSSIHSSSTDGDDTANIIVITEAGDLLLEVRDEKLNQAFTYRVDINRTSQASAYFHRLLDPNKFEEGSTVSVKLEVLRKCHKNFSDVPMEELPRIRISNIGRISKVSSIKQLFGDFLKVLHGQDIGPPSPGAAAIPLGNLANLAVVADRFDALPHVTAYIRRKRFLETLDARGKAKPAKASEERLRQRLLVGALFDHSPWIMSASQNLIITGSARWKPEASADDDLPLWHDLPLGLEDELIMRRNYVLDTLQSLALHFVQAYSSGVQQCRLGYASSWVCDSFQLGEMTKFLKKNNLIKIAPILTGQEEIDPYSGDIERILDIYKSCPTYKMDEYHNHCGMRTRLVPIIEHLEILLRASSLHGVGICGECWKTHRIKYAWTDAMRPVGWQAPVPRPPSHLTIKHPGSEACLQQHIAIRNMFLAVERLWTFNEDRSEGIRFGKTTPFLKYD